MIEEFKTCNLCNESIVIRKIEENIWQDVSLVVINYIKNIVKI